MICKIPRKKKGEGERNDENEIIREGFFVKMSKFEFA